MSAHKQKYEEQIQTTNQAHREYLMVRSDYRIALKKNSPPLRAEKAELIEALRDAWDALKEADRRFSVKTGNALSEQITQTLAKYETK